DGPVENMTALVLLIASFTMTVHGTRCLVSEKNRKQIGIIALLIALAFFVFAGEEISWGQRVLDIETGEFMQQYNWQGEVNLHNLQTDVANIGFHYGALIFLIILPLFHSKILQLLKKLP